MEIRIALVVALLAVALAGWTWATRHTVRFRPSRGATDIAGLPLGEAATLLQFSLAACSTCPGVSRMLADVAAEHAGVSYVEVDSAERPDLVRAHDIRRAPTVLLLDRDGAVVSRSSGPVTRGEVLAALATRIPPEAR